MATMMELQNQNNDVIKKYINESKYPDEIKKEALNKLQNSDFYITGLYEMLLNSINHSSNLDDYGNRLDDLENPEPDPTDPTNPAFDLEGRLKDITTEIGDAFDSKLNETVKTITEKNSVIIQTNEQILSQVKSIEMSGNLSDRLVSLYNRIAELSRQSQSDMTIIKSAGADGVLRYEEKLAVNPVWIKIRAEKNSIIDQLELYDVNIVSYEDTFEDLKEYMTSLSMGSGRDTVIDYILFVSKFQNYFDARHDSLIYLYNVIRDETMELAESFVDTSLDIASINRLVSEANTSSSDVRRLLITGMSDGLLTPIEKERIKIYYDDLLDRYEIDIDLASKYNVNSTNLTNKFNSLKDKVDSSEIFRFYNEFIAIDAEDLADSFEEFYSAQVIMYEVILSKMKDRVNSFSENVNYYATNIDQIDKRLTLTAESVEAIGDMIKVNRAYIDLQSDKISLGVSDVTAPRDIANSIDDLQSMGENLYIIGKSQPGYVSVSTGDIFHSSINGSRYSEWINIISDMYVTLSIENNTIENTIKIIWYGEDKEFIKADYQTFNTEEIVMTILSPSESVFAIIEVQDAKNCNIQFEYGSRATPYQLSIYDLMNNVVLAKNLADIKSEDYREFNEKMVNYSAKNYRSVISTMIEDNALSISEKNQLQTIVDDMVLFYDNLVSHMDEIGTSYNLLEQFYTELMSDLYNILSDRSTKTTIVGMNLSNKLNRYVNELDIMVRVTKNNLEFIRKEAIDLWSKSSASAIEAEDLKNQLMIKAENMAKLISNTKKLLREEIMYDVETEHFLERVAVTQQLTPENKVYINEYLSKIKNDDKWFGEQADKLNLGKAAFVRTRMNLIDYLDPMLTINSLNEPSRIVSAVFLDRFTSYFQAKQNLLNTIISSLEIEYELLQLELSNAIALARAKNEEFINYQNAVDETQRDMDIIRDNIAELTDAVPYILRLNSSRGDKFTNSNIDTTLTCTIHRGDVDITDKIKDEHFIWTKIDKDGNPDLEWNGRHEGVGNTVDLDHTDIDEKAIFRVEVFQEIGQVSSEGDDN